MRLGNIPHPFPYQGSKRKLAPIIVECIPKKTKCLIEPFAGSAAVSVATAWLERAESFMLNDTHVALIALWGRIIRDPRGLCDDYRRIWEGQIGREREYYDQIRDQFNRDQRPEHLLFLLARCVKAAIRYNRAGQFNNSPDNRRRGMKPDNMEKNIMLVSQILGEDAELSAEDYAVVLKKAGPSDLVYMDPPYQGVCKNRDNRYVEGVNFHQFVDELKCLNRRNVPFVVSYDGRTGDISYGEKLPDSLGLYHVELLVGRSTQATLLGRTHNTYEALYLSPAVLERLGGVPPVLSAEKKEMPTLFG